MPGSFVNWLLTVVESGPWLDQEAPIWLFLFHTKDLLCGKHWSTEEEGAVRGVATTASGPCVRSPPSAWVHTLLTHPGAVEDTGGHPAGAERWHQAAEVGLPVGLQLPRHCPVVKNQEPSGEAAARPPVEGRPSWYLCTASSESSSGSGGSSTGSSTGTSGSSGTTGSTGASGCSASTQALEEHTSWAEQGRRQR